MRRELTKHGFQLEETTSVQDGIQVNGNDSSLFLMKQELWGSWFKTRTTLFLMICTCKTHCSEMDLDAKCLERLKQQLVLKNL